jgi:hypothetical protein
MLMNNLHVIGKPIQMRTMWNDIVPIAPTITENNTTITPAPEVNNTLIGRSTPTTSNTSLQIDNKTGL